MHKSNFFSLAFQNSCTMRLQSVKKNNDSSFIWSARSVHKWTVCAWRHELNNEEEFLQFYTCGIDVWGNSLHLLDLKYWLRGLFEPWKIFCPNSCFFCSNGLSSWWLQINFNNDFFSRQLQKVLDFPNPS